MGVIAIILALVLLSILCFKGVPVILASLLSSIFFLIITTPTGAFEGITTSFMAGAANFMQNYFLTFLGGALFGAIVEMSGAAESIAQAIVGRVGNRFIIVGIIIATAILTLGGVSVYVAFFAIYPFAVSLFKKADIPRRLFAAAYMVGGGTFTMTMPFSPAIQNIIPTTYLGTTASAGMGVGLIGAVFCFLAGSIYMHKRQQQCKKNGEHFVPLPSDVEVDPDAKRPSVLISILPMVILLICLNGIGLAIELSLLAAIISGLILYFPYYPHDAKTLWKKLGDATSGAVNSILNTGATVGFGQVISASAAFAGVVPVVTNLGGNPLIGAAVATTVLAGLSGSASGGLGIAIPLVGEVYLPMGVNPGSIHRIASVASSGLDSLPHNGGVITFLNYSHTTHKEGYRDIAVVSVLITLLQLVLEIVLFIALGQVFI